MKSKFEVYVGNIGMVYDGNNKEEAKKVFVEYVEQSTMKYGRASNEDVTLFEEGEPIENHFAFDVED